MDDDVAGGWQLLCRVADLVGDFGASGSLSSAATSAAVGATTSSSISATTCRACKNVLWVLLSVGFSPSQISKGVQDHKMFKVVVFGSNNIRTSV